MLGTPIDGCGKRARSSRRSRRSRPARSSARSRREIQGSGYVVRSLEAALWALHTTDDFRDGALRAVNLGDDADTTGAVYGQLAGAIYGEEAIPAEWLDRLTHRDMIAGLADSLLQPATHLSHG